MSRRSGRPKKYDIDKEQEEVLLKHIQDYNNNHNPHPTIKYKHVWEYFLALYSQNQFEYETSYDFWKRPNRLGRKLVDKINSYSQTENYLSTTTHIDLINIKELIEKYGGPNKDIIWENLKPYDKHISRFAALIEKLETKNLTLVNEMTNLQNKIVQLQESNDKLQMLVFTLFVNSNKENELVNLINTGQSKSKLINIALEDTFNEPKKFFNDWVSITNNLKYFEENLQAASSKVISINKKLKKDKIDEPEYEL